MVGDNDVSLGAVDPVSGAVGVRFFGDGVATGIGIGLEHKLLLRSGSSSSSFSCNSFSTPSLRHKTGDSQSVSSQRVEQGRRIESSEPSRNRRRGGAPCTLFIILGGGGGGSSGLPRVDG